MCVDMCIVTYADMHVDMCEGMSVGMRVTWRIAPGPFLGVELVLEPRTGDGADAFGLLGDHLAILEAELVLNDVSRVVVHDHVLHDKDSDRVLVVRVVHAAR